MVLGRGGQQKRLLQVVTGCSMTIADDTLTITKGTEEDRQACLACVDLVIAYVA